MKRPKRGVSRPTPHTFLEFICDFRLLESHYDVGLQDVSHLLGGGGHCGYLVAQQRDCDRDLALGVAHLSGGCGGACPQTYVHQGERGA